MIGTQVRCPNCQAIFLASNSERSRTEVDDAFREPAPSPFESRDRSSRRLPPRPVLHDFEDDVEDERFFERRRSYKAPHRGGMILTFGILGLVGALLCIQIPMSFFSVAAWIMGHIDLKEIREGRMDPAGEGQTKAGWVMGIIGTLILVIEIFGCMLFIAASAVT